MRRNNFKINLENQEIHIDCRLCKKTFKIHVTNKELFDLQTSDKHIQNILPNVSPDIRELFISNTCPDCWNKLFPKNEEY